MADTTMLDLPTAVSVDGSEYAWIVQGGTDKRVTLADIANTAAGLLPTGGLAGQVLIKESSANYDTGWATVSGIGTVTSVALALPISVFAVSGSPVTAAGTLTGSFQTQVANRVFAGPATGADAVPTFRALASADFPIIGLAQGGTGAALTASNGGIFYSNATTGAILSGTATANQALLSGSSAAPAWSTATYPPTTTINQLLYSSSANVIAGLGTVNGGILNAGATGIPALTVTPVLGLAGTSLGSLGFSGNTSGLVTIKPQAVAGTFNFNLPISAGTAGQLLQSGGGGSTAMTWSTATFPTGSGATGTILRSDGTNWVATTATYPATTTINQLLYSSSASVIAGLATANGGILNTGATGIPSITATPVLGLAGTTVGSLGFQNATSGTITVSPVTGALGTVTLTLPAATDTFAVLAASQALTNKTYNGLTITGSTGTLTITNAKTLAVSNSLTLTGTDSTSFAFPSTSSTVITTGNTATITKGYSVTPNNIGTVSSGTTTPDPANGNYQYLTNNGAFTMAVPGSDCAIDILVTNGASAGSITFSGYTAPSGGGGDTYNTTNTNKFILVIRRINGVSTYLWKALQ